MSLLPTIKEYISDLTDNNYSEYTIKDYMRILDDFNEFVGTTSPSELTILQIKNYKKALIERGLIPRTQNYNLIVVRQFLKYCFKNDIQTVDYRKIELARTKRNEANFLDFKELENVFKSINTETAQGIRDMAIIQMLYCTGMRVGEVAKLNFFDIDLKTKQFSFIGKGRKPRTAFLSPLAVYWIQRYLETRNDNCNALFINYRNARKTNIRTERRRLSITSIQSIVRFYAKKAGIKKKITPHTLRHTFGTHMRLQGCDIQALQDMLGHTWITTTQEYSHLSKKFLQESHSRYLPYYRKISLSEGFMSNQPDKWFLKVIRLFNKYKMSKKDKQNIKNILQDVLKV